MHRVHRFLSALLIAALPAFAADPAPGKSLLVLGDSLAAGFGLDPAESFPSRLQQLADAANLSVTVINGGVSGDTSAGGLRRIDWMLRRPVDVLVLELGGNDGLRGLAPASTGSNLVQIIRKTRERNPSVEVIVAGMQMPPNMGEDYGTRFREVFPQVATAERAILMPFLLEGVGGIAEFNQPDQVHPTATGHAIIASNLWVILEPVLKKVTSPRPVTSPGTSP